MESCVNKKINRLSSHLNGFVISCLVYVAIFNLAISSYVMVWMH